jgi:hypothetical protein
MASSVSSPVFLTSTRPTQFKSQTTEMEREYEFFVTTDEHHQPEGQERGLIRRLVMRNFFETKWSGPSNNSSELNSASTVQSKQRLRSRFRLPKPGQEFTQQKSTVKRRKPDKPGIGDGDKREGRTRNTRTQSGVSETSEPSIASCSGSGRASPVDGECVESGNPRPRILLKINPGSHRFDPFDVLPVPGSPQLDTLFKLCEYSPTFRN